MRNKALALGLAAKRGDRIPDLLALLPEERRAAVEAALSDPPQDPVTELSRMRQQELDSIESRHAQSLGPVWQELRPDMRFWAWGRIKLR